MSGIKIHFAGGDDAAFDTFAIMYPVEAFDAYHDRFCKWMRDNDYNLTDDEIKELVESTRGEVHTLKADEK
ncbi:MAG: hypothetical protein FD170_3942 [Bacteroidetes bacterium]|nr:MAG: hypothetical protein FD170_3942 [Bacteroidota bacterium]